MSPNKLKLCGFITLETRALLFPYPWKEMDDVKLGSSQSQKKKKKKIGHGVQAPETHGQAAEFKEKKQRKHN